MGTFIEFRLLGKETFELQGKPYWENDVQNL